MRWPEALRTALLLSLLVTVAAACGPQEVRVSPTPTAGSATPPARTSAPATTPTATATRVATPAPAPTPTGPGGTPAAACPTQTGGSEGNRVLLTAVRVARHDGYDRIVYEFSPSAGPGAYGVPPYAIEAASSLSGPSGQPVTVDGNALLGVRFRNTDAHDDQGRQTIGDADVRAAEITPAPALIREVRLVEDFEGTVVWGVGLDRPVCPKVTTLSGPVRVVLDFAAP